MHNNTTVSAAVPLWIILLLASIVAVTPLAIDMYLPAFPAITQSLQADMEQVQISLSTYLAGFACSMLVFGPIADIVGRRRLVISGLAGFSVMSVLLSFVTSIEWFWILRAGQAISGGAAAVVIPGIISHLYGKDTAKGMSYVSMIMMLAPLAAPTLGSVVLHWFDWHGIFILLAAYAFLLLAPGYRWLPTLPTQSRQGSWSYVFFSSYKTVLRSKEARPFILTSMFTSFAFFGYLTAIPAVYMDVFGVNEKQFSILFAINVGALIMANLVNSRIVVRLGSRRMLRISITLCVISSVALLSANWLQMGLMYTVVSVIPLMAGLGLTAVNSDALILIAFPQHTGTATAVIGTLRFGCGALVGPILAAIHTPTALPFSGLMFVAVCLIVMTQMFGFFSRHRANR